GGWKPGLLAALVGFFAGTFLFLDPSLAFRIGVVGKTLGGAVYWGSCLLIIGLGESLRRARDRHHAAEQRLRVSQEVSLQGYALFSAVRDDDGAIRDLRFEYVNPRGAEIARTGLDNLVGRNLREALPNTTRNGVYDMLVRVVETGEPSDHE